MHNRTSLLAAVLAVSSVAVGAGVGASPAMAGVGPWHYVAGDAGTDREDTVS